MATSRTSRRRMLALLAGLAASSSLAGCLGAGQPSPEQPPGGQPTATRLAPTPPAPTATPAPPKAVRIGMSREPDALAGYPGGTYAATVVQNLVFNALVGVDDRMQPYPDLAESVPTLENGGAKWIGEGASRQLQTTFRLRPGVTWSDGQPLTSRDVRFTWDLMLNPGSGAHADLEAKYERVETPDDRTVVFTMWSESSARAAYARDRDAYYDLRDQRGPVLDPLYSFGINGSWILPEHVLGPLVDGQPRTSPKAADLFAGSRFAREPVGTGPYTLRDWRPGASLTFAARPDYFKGPPRIQTVTVTFAADARSLIDQLGRGDLDVITQDALDVTAAPTLDALAGARAWYVPGAGWEHLDFNLDDPVLKDKSIRQAIAHAIDRREIVAVALSGKAAPLASVVPDWSWAHAPDVPGYPYDPDRARQLLDDAGWRPGPDGVRAREGRRLVLAYVSTDWAVRVATAQVLKRQLAAIGVGLTVEHVPSNALLQVQTGRLARRSFQLAQYAWVSGIDPGAELYYFYGSESVPTEANAYRGGNYPGYRSAEADRLLAAGLATLDRPERVRIYRDLQRVIAADLPSLPLFCVPNVAAASARLAGFRPGIGAIGETWNAHEWDLR